MLQQRRGTGEQPSQRQQPFEKHADGSLSESRKDEKSLRMEEKADAQRTRKANMGVEKPSWPDQKVDKDEKPARQVPLRGEYLLVSELPFDTRPQTPHPAIVGEPRIGPGSIYHLVGAASS